MRKAIGSGFLTMALFGASLVSLGAVTPAELKLGERGLVKWVHRTPPPEQMGQFDSLVLTPADATAGEQVIFETEGRLLEKWEMVDLEGKGSGQLLLSLDPGGNGGFKEFALLTASGTGFAVAWEETLKMGSIEVKDLNGDSRPEVVLKGLEMNPATGKVLPKTLNLTWQDGTLVPMKAKK